MFSFNGENKSIYEPTIPYCRTHDSRQRINNKQIRLGYNIWILAEAYGYVVQCEPNEGLKKGKQVPSTTYCRLGENVVLRRIACSSPTLSYHLFMDNYFTSFRQLTHLGVNDVNE